MCIKGQYTWLYKECDLPSSSPAGSSSIPCKFVQNYTHCIILINSIIQPRITYQASLPTLSSSLEIKFWSSESDAYQSSWCFFYLHQLVYHSLCVDPSRVKFSPSSILQIECYLLPCYSNRNRERKCSITTPFPSWSTASLQVLLIHQRVCSKKCCKWT